MHNDTFEKKKKDGAACLCMPVIQYYSKIDHFLVKCIFIGESNDFFHSLHSFKDANIIVVPENGDDNDDNLW